MMSVQEYAEEMNFNVQAVINKCRELGIKANSKDDMLDDEAIIMLDNTLEKLYKRDNGICKICGHKCDYTDYYIDENGTYIAGNNYPSIDHIKPISKGGCHTWENVQLAHRICNTIKNDKVKD